jgi:hypothetical protein
MWFDGNIWLEKMGRKWMMLVCGYALFQLRFDCIFGGTPQFFQGFMEAIAMAIANAAARASSAFANTSI